MNNDPEEHMNGGGRKPVAQKEIGPEDVEDVIDFDVDSDEEFDLEELEEDDSLSDEMESLQAAQFLVNPGEQQVPDNLLGEEDSDDVSEASQTIDEVSEASQTIDEVSEASQTIDDMSEISQTEEQANQPTMEVPEDSVDEDSEDVDENSQDVEQHVMEISEILKDVVEYRTRKGELDENQLGAENISVPIAKCLNPEHCAGTSGSGDNQKLNVMSSVSGKEQEPDDGTSNSDKDREQDKVSSPIEKDQEDAESSGSSNDGAISGSNKDQEDKGDSFVSSENQKEDAGSSSSSQDQIETNGCPTGEDPVEQLIHEDGSGDNGERMERLELEVQHGIQEEPPYPATEVEQDLDGEVNINENLNATSDEEDHAGMNGGPTSGEDPEDQQVKVIQIVGNEEADIGLEFVPEQAQDVIEADLEVDVAQDDEQNNLVEEIVEERQAMHHAVADIVPEPAVGAEEHDNILADEDTTEVPLDHFNHKA